jgi:hypothetical protein
MQFNGRATDYLATDEGVRLGDAGKLPLPTVRNESILGLLAARFRFVSVWPGPVDWNLALV